MYIWWVLLSQPFQKIEVNFQILSLRWSYAFWTYWMDWLPHFSFPLIISWWWSMPLPFYSDKCPLLLHSVCRIAVVHDSLPMLVLALLADVSAFSFRTGPKMGQHVFLLQQHNYEHLICRPTIYCASSRKLLTARFNIDWNFFNHVDFGSEYWGCICQSSIQYLSGQDCL